MKTLITLQLYGGIQVGLRCRPAKFHQQIYVDIVLKDANNFSDGRQVHDTIRTKAVAGYIVQCLEYEGSMSGDLTTWCLTLMLALFV